jgi:predicted ATPase
LLRTKRQQLHARLVLIVEEQFPELIATQPERLAQHCMDAGRTEKAVGYWLTAGQKAVARSAMTEAVAQLQKGLRLLASLPDGSWHQQQELDLLVALGKALSAAKGFSAPETAETFARARALSERLDRPEHLVPLLLAQAGYHVVRSELTLALSLTEQIEQIGQYNASARSLGHFQGGMVRYLLGELVAARSCFEQCQGLGGPVQRVPCATLDPDTHAIMLSWLGMTLFGLGFIDQGRSRLSEALLEANELGHAFTQAHVLNNMCVFAWTLRLPHEVERRAEEVLALSKKHNFPFWSARGIAFLGWSSVARRQGEEEGIRLLTNGLMAVRATGAAASWMLIMLADAYAMVGQPVEGMTYLADAAQSIEKTRESVVEAELHRLRGAVLIASRDPVGAERSYHRALVVARHQSAKVFELRASTSLARLWRDQGKRTEARDLLAPIYGWFTEGFDTLDLKDAKALLDELAS